MTPQERKMVIKSIEAIEEIVTHLKNCEHLQMGANPEASYGNLKAMANQYGRQLEGRIADIRNVMQRE